MFIEFCVPVYNEEKLLENNALKLLAFCEKQNFSFNWRIVIINNGSTDSSEKICRKLQSEKIKIEKIAERGKGKAIKSYFINSKADIVVYMDIDLAVSLDNILDLIHPVLSDKADLVIGSRMLPYSRTNRSFIRELSSRGYNFLSRIILNHNLSDLQCGFKAIKTSEFKKIAPFILNKKWFFDTELIAFANLFGCKIKEVPVDWSENRYKKRKSKINILKDGVIFIYNLIKLKLRLLKNYKKLKEALLRSSGT